MLKKVLIILLAIVLLISPLIIRWLYFYEGRYQPAEVPRPDLTQIEEPQLATEPFTDHQVEETFGTILLDLAHENRVRVAELNVLQARLAARGHRLVPVIEADDLASELRKAQALVIISPGQDWSTDEIWQVQEFVEKGGRLLLVTDPTRFAVLYDEWGDYLGLDYDSPHINDLATRFGLVFQADYLYNTVDNEGNFRNIRLTDLTEHALTKELDQLVFYAAHSIVSDELALITARGETRSSTSERAKELTVGLLAADGAVLALGDLTFMTEPYNAVHDNDRFIANIADFLSNAQRRYELADFPSFFGERVDLVYAGDPLLDGGLLKGGSTLQRLFAREGRSLTLRQAEDDAQDTLFFGLYQEAEQVEPYLTAAQATLVITPTEDLEKKPTPAPPAEGTPLPSSSQPLTTTAPITPSLDITVTQTPEPESAAGIEPPSPAANRVVIEPLGEMVLTGTSLLLLQADGDRNVMVVLSDTEEGLDNALGRLTKGDLAGCLLHEVETRIASLLALCPTSDQDGGGGWQEPDTAAPSPTPKPPAAPTVEPPGPPAEPRGSIIILSMDQGQGRYDSLTGADEYASILEEDYEVTVWSIAQEGPPDPEDLTKYDLAIWTAGDFEDPLADQYSDLLFDLMLEGMPQILSGAYIGETETEAVQRDIQVEDATHPLARGFKAEEVIGFVSPPSGKDYQTGVLEEFEADQGSLIFVRGPDSEAAGIPSIVTLEGEFDEFQVVFIGFPIYLLPEVARSQLVQNAVSWLQSP